MGSAHFGGEPSVADETVTALKTAKAGVRAECGTGARDSIASWRSCYPLDRWGIPSGSYIILRSIFAVDPTDGLHSLSKIERVLFSEIFEFFGKEKKKKTPAPGV